MASEMEKKNEQEQQVNSQQTTPDATQNTEMTKSEEKKGFFRSLGTGVKIAIGIAATVVVTGGVYLVSVLLGKDDKEDEAAPEANNEPNE